MPHPLSDIWPGLDKPIIGMLHLKPLPGSHRYGGDRRSIRQALLADADALVQGGADGLMIENFGDAPFHPGPVPAHTVADITALAAAVRDRHLDTPLGVNVLRNDACAALSIAAALGLDYIRVNVLCGARVTDQGIIEAVAHDLLRLRRHIDADHVRILADVDVKHSAPLAERSIEDEVADTVERGGADALIASGSATGSPTDPDHLRRIRRAALDTPLLVGSGVTAGTIADLADHADGFIVGSSVKADTAATHPVDPRRVERLVAALRNPA